MPPLTPVINAANPYLTATAPNLQYENPIVVEQQVDVGNWNFKGVPRHVEKALRIPYTYTDENGVRIREFLLIGYEGGGAY